MGAPLEDLEACGADARLYLKPVGLVDSPQWHDGKNQRLNNSLTWFSQIEYLVVEAGKPNLRGLVNVTQWPEWSKALPERLAERAAAQFANLTRQHVALECGDRTIRFDQPHVMGILNITPDSFSDGGKHQDDPEKAAEAGLAMAIAGASILDIGGESTPPGANPVWEGDAWCR